MTIRLGQIVVFCVAFACTAPLWAQDRDMGDFDIGKVRQAVEEQRAIDGDSLQAPRAVARAEDSIGAIILRITGYLALVILLILGLFWLLRRMGIVGTSRIGGGSMDVLEALPLGQGRYVILVRVMDRVLVLAQSAQQTTLLEKLEGQKALEVIASTKGGTSIVQFKDMFNSFMGKVKKPSREDA